MSEALLGRFDSLQYTEEEVQEVIGRRLNLDEHPDLRADIARLPKERAAYMMSRDSAVDKIVWGKFSKKMKDRGLRVRWADEVTLPNTFPVMNPTIHETEKAWFEKNAPDLIDELETHRQWQRERNSEWARIWEHHPDNPEGIKDVKTDEK